MLKHLRSLLGVARDGEHPREIAVAVLLGTLAGFVHGWNLTLVMVLLAVLLLRAPLKMFGQAWAVAGGLAWTLTPVTYRLGQALLSLTSIGDWLAPHADSIWLALFDLDRYTLLGGLAIAPILGLPAAVAVGWATHVLQRRYQTLQQKIQTSQQFQGSRWIRLAGWLLLGSSAKAKQVPTRAKWFRPIGVALTGLVIAPAMLFGWIFLPTLVERSILRGLTAANQAEVNAERLELSLSDGMLAIDGLQLADPANLEQDRLRIDHITAVLKPGPLLRGCVHVEQVLIEGIASDVPRQRRAKPFGAKKLPKLSPAEEEPTEQSAYSLAQYMPEWKRLEPQFRQLQQFLERIETLMAKHAKRPTTTEQAEQADPLEALSDDDAEMTPAYRELRSRRHAFGAPWPHVWIQDVRMKGLPSDWGLGQDAAVQLTDLASDARLAGRPARMVLVAHGGTVKAEAQFNLHRPGTQHQITFEARDLSLQKLLDPAKLGGTFQLGGGKLALSGRGTMTSEGLDLPLNVSAKQLDLKLGGDRKLGGLSADLWNQGLAKLGGLDVQSRLTGRWRSPRLRLSATELTGKLQEQLRAAGHEVLARAAQQQLEIVAKQRDKVKGIAKQAERAVAAAAATAPVQANTAMDKTTQLAQQQIQHGQDVAKDWLKDPFGNRGGGVETGAAAAQRPFDQTAPRPTGSVAQFNEAARGGPAVGPYTEMRPGTLAPRPSNPDPYATGSNVPPSPSPTTPSALATADTRTPGQVYADRYSIGAQSPSPPPANASQNDPYAPATAPRDGTAAGAGQSTSPYPPYPATGSSAAPYPEPLPDRRVGGPAYEPYPTPAAPSSYPTTSPNYPYPSTAPNPSPPPAAPYPSTDRPYPTTAPTYPVTEPAASPGSQYPVTDGGGNAGTGRHAESMTHPATPPRAASEPMGGDSSAPLPRPARNYDFYEDETPSGAEGGSYPANPPTANDSTPRPGNANGGNAMRGDMSGPGAPPHAQRPGQAPLNGAPPDPAGGAPPGAAPAATSPPQNDEWRITRWSRQAKDGVTGMLFGTPQPAQQQPQATQPQAPPSPQSMAQRLAGPANRPPQPQNNAPQYQTPSNNSRYARRPPPAPRPGLTSRQSQNLPPPQPQSANAKPWYQFW